MRLWSEERKSGTIEMLLTLPVTMWQAVVGKFLAAWAFIGIALVLTFPIWITVNYLGSPDNGRDLRQLCRQLPHGRRFSCRRFLHLGVHAQPGDRLHPHRRRLLPVPAGGIPAGAEFFSAWAPQGMVDAISGLSFLNHFVSISKGVIDLRDLIYFLLTIAFWLYASAVVIDLKKAD